MSTLQPTRRLAALTAALVLSAGPAAATIVSGSTSTSGTTFVALTIPLTGSTPTNTVGADNFNSPNLYGFNESQNIFLASSLVMDQGGTITAGSTVASHYIFFDPLQGSNIVGSVVFDSDVLGIITSTGLLAASDFLVNTGVNYMNPTLRGLEAVDTVSFSGQQISLNFTASSPGDYIRVITRFSPGAVPEPGSLALVGLALAGAGLMRRRKA